MAKSKIPKSALEFFREQGAIGGKIGGKKVAEAMTPEERSQRARTAALASNAARKARKAAAAADPALSPAPARKRATPGRKKAEV